MIRSKRMHFGNFLFKFHSLSFPIFLEENSSMQVTNEICLIYPSLDVKLEEYFDLVNIFVEDVNYNQINDVDGLHLDNSDLIEIYNGSYPYNMHYLIESSISHSKILERYNTSHNSYKIPELGQIWIFSQNYFICMA